MGLLFIHFPFSIFLSSLFSILFIFYPLHFIFHFHPIQSSSAHIYFFSFLNIPHHPKFKFISSYILSILFSFILILFPPHTLTHPLYILSLQFTLFHTFYFHSFYISFIFFFFDFIFIFNQRKTVFIPSFFLLFLFFILFSSLFKSNQTFITTFNFILHYYS